MKKFFLSSLSCIRMTLAGSALLVAGTYQVALAAEKTLLATPSSPASITAAVAPNAHAVGHRHIVLRVVGIQPPKEGDVLGVVKAEINGAEREIGRFHTSKPLRFGFSMPDELAAADAVKLKVYLIPSEGEGRGAWMQFGGADIWD